MCRYLLQTQKIRTRCYTWHKAQGEYLHSDWIDYSCQPCTCRYTVMISKYRPSMLCNNSVSGLPHIQETSFALPLATFTTHVTPQCKNGSSDHQGTTAHNATVVIIRYCTWCCKYNSIYSCSILLHFKLHTEQCLEMCKLDDIHMPQTVVVCLQNCAELCRALSLLWSACSARMRGGRH